jgi:hypothetical protein
MGAAKQAAIMKEIKTQLEATRLPRTQPKPHRKGWTYHLVETTYLHSCLLCGSVERVVTTTPVLFHNSGEDPTSITINNQVLCCGHCPQELPMMSKHDIISRALTLLSKQQGRSLPERHLGPRHHIEEVKKPEPVRTVARCAECKKTDRISGMMLFDEAKGKYLCLDCYEEWCLKDEADAEAEPYTGVHDDEEENDEQI